MVVSCEPIEQADGTWRCPRCGYRHRLRFAKTCVVESPRIESSPAAVEADYEQQLRKQRRGTLRKLILSKVNDATRQTAEIEALLDGLPETAWPCGGCPEKVYGFIAAVLDPDVWREEWGKWRRPNHQSGPVFAVL